jgi:glutamyl-tRNA(Gln) amidotransferase subunit D
MSDDIFQGYKGKALELLKKYKVRVWGKCEVETTRGKFEGTVLPRSENDDDLHIVLKIITGLQHWCGCGDHFPYEGSGL